MSFLEILKNYLTEKNQIRRMEAEQRIEQRKEEKELRKQKRNEERQLKEAKSRWVVVAKVEEGWTKSRHGLEYSKGKVFYTLMENAAGDRKILMACDDDAYKDCYRESDDYKVRLRAWYEGARNIEGVMTYEQAEAQMIIDELKG